MALEIIWQSEIASSSPGGERKRDKFSISTLGLQGMVCAPINGVRGGVELFTPTRMATGCVADGQARNAALSSTNALQD